MKSAVLGGVQVNTGNAWHRGVLRNLSRTLRTIRDIGIIVIYEL